MGFVKGYERNSVVWCKSDLVNKSPAGTPATNIANIGTLYSVFQFKLCTI